MKIKNGNPEIKQWNNNSIIIPANKYQSLKEAVEKEYKNLRYADLRYADLRSADLDSANLRSTDLRSADLRSADLDSANLRYADLDSADLRYADLDSADLDEPTIYSDIYYLLTLQKPTILKAWKYLLNGKSPYQFHSYEVGKVYKFDDMNEDKYELCGKGGNIATLNWCLKNNLQADEFIEVEFDTKDLIVPYFTDGKFRTKKFKVLRKLNRKRAINLIKGEK